MLWTGYAASLQQGELYTGSTVTFMETWDLDDLGPEAKFWYLLPSIGAQAFLTFVQLPYLAFLYIINGGVKNGLPHGYMKLLFIVAITWLAFPAWWALSYEGLSIITDTKMNALGFALLNVIAKGSFTLHMLSITRWHRREKERAEVLAAGHQRRPSVNGSLFKEGTNTGVPDGPEENLQAVERKSERSDTWIVQLLRPYDKMGTATQNWATLSPTYQGFLMGRGITPTGFEMMQVEERAALSENFVSIVSWCNNGGQEVAKATGTSFLEPSLRLLNLPSKVVIEATLKEQEHLDCSTPSKDVRSRYTPSGSPSDSNTRSLPSGNLYDKTWGVQEIKIGQKLMTVSGAEGRVVKNMGSEVVLIMADNCRKVVGLDELARISITILGVRGIRNANWGGKHRLMPFCSCRLTDKPSSEVRTPPVAPASIVTWKHEAEILSAKLGNNLIFSVWGLDKSTGDEFLLGDVTLTSEMFIEDGFDGELQLFQNNKPLQAYLKVLVAGVGLPEHLFTALGSTTNSVQPIPVLESGRKGEGCCASCDVRRI